MQSPKLSCFLLALLVCAACESRPTQSVQQADTSAPSPARHAEADPTPDIQPPAAPVVLLPDGDSPDGGWPTLVMLHGYRSSQRDFVPVGQLAAAEGIAAISLPAPFERGEGHYHWKQGEPEHTHAYLQGVVGDLAEAKDGKLDTDRLWLAGFSQGAMHSVHLAAKYPDAYRGVLAISPAGWTPAPDSVVEPEVRRDFVVIGGRAEKARYRDSFFATRDLLTKSELPVEVIEHDGGHRFPPNWRAQFTRIFAAWADEPR